MMEKLFILLIYFMFLVVIPFMFFCIIDFLVVIFYHKKSIVIRLFKDEL